jgi:ribosomal protein S18 acetylase RimI-like enzyme
VGESVMEFVVDKFRENYWDIFSFLQKEVKGRVSKENREKGMAVTFDYLFYINLDREGKLFTILVKEKEKVVGCLLAIIMYHPHYKTLLGGHITQWLVKEEFRGNGIGKMLLEVTQRELRDKVDYLTLAEKSHLLYPTLVKDNWAIFETTFIKWL